MDHPPPPCLDPNGLATIASRLIEPMFSSKAVVEIDSIIVSSLFGQRAKKKQGRSHRMQTLSLACVVDNETRDGIHSAFEQGKKDLVFTNPRAYMDTAKKIAMRLYRGSGLLKSHGSESHAIIEWCIAAYSMAINPASSVKLSCVKMGAAETLGFAIHAVNAIKKGQAIRELIGLMPKDGKAKHSDVLCIKPNASNNQSSSVERVLFGPIRFINHICSMPNAEASSIFIAINDTSAFWVSALRDIAPGEELFVDYGKGWFADEPGGCPCLTCKPEHQSKKRQPEEKDEATVQAEIKESRKAKRKRTMMRKKAKYDEMGNGIAGSSGTQ